MCSQGGGKSTPIMGVMHACYLCDHAKAIEMVHQLQEQLQQFSTEDELTIEKLKVITERQENKLVGYVLRDGDKHRICAYSTVRNGIELDEWASLMTGEEES